ncbi:MAG: Trk system potassium transporter TrkA [Flavobacteriales bacterium]|nr:MAG: Trk system potassium transporter TrkA [Flavobacteriales bacterium]
MKIIIAGAGDVGFHLAKLLSYESQDIYIIDQSATRLEYINSHLDVITLKGDATSVSLLKQANVEHADLLLAVTESQNTNFTIASIGKKLGVKKTIARINNSEFLTNTDVDFKSIGIDFMISPEALAAEEIKSLLNQSVFNDAIPFENGDLMILGGTLSNNSPLINKTVKESRMLFPDFSYISVALRREYSKNTIIPRGNTRFEADDQVYFAVPGSSTDNIYTLLGKEKFGVKDVMILGGSTIGQKTANKLCKDHFNVKIIEINRNRAFEISETISDALVINGDGRDVELLEEENIDEMDAFVAVTGNSETNIMSCLVAKSKGVKKTIALVENMDYINISQTIGIDTLINKKLLAASSIFKHVRKGDVVSMASTHNMDAEILEFEVKPNTPVTKHPIKDLKLTRDAVFSGVVRDDKIMMTYGDFQIQAGDKVIVFALQEAVHKVEDLFNH